MTTLRTHITPHALDRFRERVPEKGHLDDRVVRGMLLAMSRQGISWGANYGGDAFRRVTVLSGDHIVATIILVIRPTRLGRKVVTILTPEQAQANMEMSTGPHHKVDRHRRRLAGRRLRREREQRSRERAKRQAA